MFNTSSTVLLFPGQGSHQVGMGVQVAREFPAAAEVFAQADALLGYALSALCFEGPAEKLDQTQYTQPALYVTGVAIFKALEAINGSPIKPLAAAGHSLGEFTALTIAGALPFEAGLKLVAERGRLMAEAGEKNPGGMAALLGASMDDARAICEQSSAEIGHPVVIGNDNCPGQVVISGDNGAVDRALELAKARGIKRTIRLQVSVATHSPLMSAASADFRKALDAAPLSAPIIPVIGNASAASLHTVEEIRAELNAQLVSTVRWTESVMALQALGAKTFLELGPKDVLTGLLKRIHKDAVGFALNTPEGLRQVVGG